MRLPALALAASLVALCVMAKAPAHADSLDDSERAAPKCWSVRNQAQYRGFGYDHVVEITNACDKPIACSVRTDVNPQPTSAQVPAHETVSVVTFRGSPAREFKAEVQCKLPGKKLD